MKFARSFTDMPARIARLPRDKRGFPVPAFVEWFDGEPDFRIMSATHWADCVNLGRCWICGDPMGANLAFTIGPMCGVNRISAEPPSHRDCARFAARNCPFLATPTAVRRERGMPENRQVAGVMIPRNPGVSAVWITKTYEVMPVHNGYLIKIGPPTAIEWYREGRAATRAEIEESVRTGYPLLEAAAARDGLEAVRELTKMRGEFDQLLDRQFEQVPA